VPDLTKTEAPNALLTPDDVAAFLGIPPLTLQSWRSRRTGPRSYRVGKHILYRLADVEAWLESQAASPQ